MKRFLAALACLLLSLTARAHIGSPNAVFEAKAGDYPVRIVIREPEVVPGLAEISVRVLSGHPDRITVLPVHSRTDLRGAPRPDEATLVPGETNLYTAALWLMAHGAYGVRVSVEGPGGGSLMTPVNALARDMKPMPRYLSAILAFLGIGLVLGLVAIFAGASRESTLPADVTPTARRTKWSLIGAVAGLALGAGMAWLGGRWWNDVDAEHRRRGIYHPTAAEWRVESGARGTRLAVRFTDDRPDRLPARIVPDHGKLLHLFLIQDAPAPGALPAFAHLHPARAGGEEFVTATPPLPKGTYRAYLDLTRESGMTETLTHEIHLDPGADAPSWNPLDPDDSYSEGGPLSGSSRTAAMPDGGAITFEPVDAVAGQAVALAVQVTDAGGAPARLQPYLGMLGHAVIERDDGKVFVHIHPAGTISLTATREFSEKIGGTGAGRLADVACGDFSALSPDAAEALVKRGRVSFPFVFDTPGSYRVWVQVKLGGAIRTAAVPLVVAGSGR